MLIEFVGERADSNGWASSGIFRLVLKNTNKSKATANTKATINKTTKMGKTMIFA